MAGSEPGHPAVLRRLICVIRESIFKPRCDHVTHTKLRRALSRDSLDLETGCHGTDLAQWL